MSQKAVLSDKKALLARLLKRHKQAYSYPLSYGQQALWFLYRHAPESPAYNMAWPVEIQGGLNVAKLPGALQALVNRHPTLRTTITLDGEQTIQTVHPTGSFQLSEHQALDWTEEMLCDALKMACEHPFDLIKGPVLKVDLFQSERNRHILILSMHHIFGDAASMTILGNELLTLYHSESSGKMAALPLLAAGYADFVREETASLNRLEGEKLAQYWKNKLGKRSYELDLPTDYPRQAVHRYNGASLPYAFAPQLTKELKRLAREQKTTLFNLILAAFQILLHRYTGQNRIRIGTPTSTRRRDNRFANVVGYMVNPIILETSIDPNADLTFRALLAQTGRSVQEALEHAAYPFPILVKALQPQRDPSHSPLFQVLLDFNDGAFELEVIPGLNVTLLDMGQMEGQFDLTLTVHSDTELKGRFKYNQDLFRPETIRRMLKHFEVLLTAIAANPLSPVKRLPILSKQEIRQLRAWNETIRDYPKAVTIPDLFEEQVLQTANHIALIFKDQQLTYRRLNDKANQLAHYMRRRP